MRKFTKAMLWALAAVLVPMAASAQEHAAASGSEWGYALGAVARES